VVTLSSNGNDLVTTSRYNSEPTTGAHAASARLRTAVQLARETRHAEMAAWCLETRAWQLLTIGNYPAALMPYEGLTE
jgi:hypothetical protein